MGRNVTIKKVESFYYGELLGMRVKKLSMALSEVFNKVLEGGLDGECISKYTEFEIMDCTHYSLDGYLDINKVRFHYKVGATKTVIEVFIPKSISKTKESVDILWTMNRDVYWYHKEYSKGLYNIVNKGLCKAIDSLQNVSKEPPTRQREKLAIEVFIKEREEEKYGQE